MLYTVHILYGMTENCAMCTYTYLSIKKVYRIKIKLKERKKYCGVYHVILIFVRSQGFSAPKPIEIDQFLQYIPPIFYHLHLCLLNGTNQFILTVEGVLCGPRHNFSVGSNRSISSFLNRWLGKFNQGGSMKDTNSVEWC